MQTINLDLSVMAVVPLLYAKQGDVGRKFKIILTDGGLPYPVPGGAAISVWYSGDSGEGNYTDIGASRAVSVSGNEITVELIAQMLKSHGSGVLCVVINGAGGDQLGTWNIPYSIEQVPGSDSEKATDYYSAFSEAVENLPYPDESLSAPGKAADAAAVGKALSEKAPAGYGFGGNAKAITNPDDATTGGIYRIYDNADMMPFAHMILLSMPYYNDWVQIGMQWTSGVMATRHHTSSAGWSEWEYINPPMALGVEYRTTKRHQGKVVYTKAVNVGALPNSTTSEAKTVASGKRVVSTNMVLEFTGTNDNLGSSNINTERFNYDVAQSGETGIWFRMTAKKDLSEYTGILTIEYTKD